MRRYRRKKKCFLLCILAKKFGNINFLKSLKEAVLEISCKPVDAGELVGINELKPVVKRNFFYEKLFSSGWKLKSCWKIWKLAVKSKKNLLKNLKTVESKKVAEKSEKPAVESKNVIQEKFKSPFFILIKGTIVVTSSGSWI